MAKTYIQKVNLKASKFGIKFSGNAEAFIEQIKQHTNERGFFNLEIKERKEADQYGNSHYLVVDEWEPGQKEQTSSQTNSDTSSDLPF